MSAILHVFENPDPSTLAKIVCHDTETEPSLPSGWVRRTPSDQKSWERMQIAAGWKSQQPEAPVKNAEEKSRADIVSELRAQLAEISARIDAL